MARPATLAAQGSRVCTPFGPFPAGCLGWGRAPEIDRGANAARPPLTDYPDSEIDESEFYEFAFRDLPR
jgi:hypothetical protein